MNPAEKAAEESQKRREKALEDEKKAQEKAISDKKEYIEKANSIEEEFDNLRIEKKIREEKEAEEVQGRRRPLRCRSGNAGASDESRC